MGPMLVLWYEYLDVDFDVFCFRASTSEPPAPSSPSLDDEGTIQVQLSGFFEPFSACPAGSSCSSSKSAASSAMATAAFLMSDDRSEASLFALDLELLFGAVEADDVVAV
eukprot:CAMPEP_0168202620 /NCGR_PEP_ID=MMETSP0139_2-20121125/24381_1 /TAXON_ID=44445 /ORGANISM="Pseudo-nitzschia australis, Strain 10249 10 AB" /LENGTH=109 /DNA_ID=CAMNT_0008128343 /DNA_START=223 /DNA_END=549 /DNA_ORIENTATION=-